MSLCKIKDFLTDHIEVVIAILVSMLFIFLICFCAIPVTETMTVDKSRWSWDIPIYVYTVHNETSWEAPPSDAYDISKEWEYHYSHTVKTGEWVDAGEPIITLKAAKNSVATLYYELRRKGEAINPEKFL